MLSDQTDIVLVQGRLRCVIARRGAELRILTDCADPAGPVDEFIWQRDADVWPDSAPILFPIVGRLKDGSYSHGGQRYHLPIHGFARFEAFEVVEQCANSATLVLRDSPTTRAVYPFAFVLKVRFTLDAHCLQIRYQVCNPAASPLLFSLGSHPGLRIPATSRGIADWSLVFDAQEQPACFRLDGELLARAATPFAFDGPRRIALSAQLFEADALIFKNLQSRHVRLVHRSGRVRVSLATGGAPTLGLWARPGASYVCIEPWYGHDDDASVTGILADKPGIVQLAPGAVFASTCAICIPPY